MEVFRNVQNKKSQLAFYSDFTIYLVHDPSTPTGAPGEWLGTPGFVVSGSVTWTLPDKAFAADLGVLVVRLITLSCIRRQRQ